MNILLLHNPTAGDDRPSERELVELLRDARHDVSCVPTDDPQLAQHLVQKVDLLLVAGGDGTVATVLEKIEGGAAPLSRIATTLDAGTYAVLVQEYDATQFPPEGGEYGLSLTLTPRAPNSCTVRR